MPLYEYDCKSCHHVVEILLRSNDQKPQCPDCGGDELERQMSAPAAPSVKGGQSSRGDQSSLPVTAPGEGCGAPRCCGGFCDS